MSKILYNSWYTLKVVIVVGYIFVGRRSNLKHKLKAITMSASYVLFNPKIYSNYWNRVCSYFSRSNHNEAVLRAKGKIHKKENHKRKRPKHLPEKQFYANNIRGKWVTALHFIKNIRESKKLNCIVVRTPYVALGLLFPYLIGVAWVCEKTGMSVKLIQGKSGFAIPEFFENPILFPHACPPENFAQIEESTPRSHVKGWPSPETIRELATHRISSEYGYNIISMLTIKQGFQQQADEWYHTNIKGKCIGVHYRGTDVIQEPSRRIKVDDYINYLKKVLDKDSYILACSDQIQFIDQIKATFSGRVLTRDIVRSDSDKPLHFEGGIQQKYDALMDILVLAKTEVVYTPGSHFIDCVRFFNPAIKIVSLEHQHRSKIGSKHIPNYQPIPEIDLVDKIKREGQTDLSA